MCGRYTLTSTRRDLEARFGVAVPTEHRPRYNCAPGQELLVVTGGSRARFFEWNYVPPDRSTDSQSYINARSETVTERPSFADAFEERRCLVLADGFYVWRTEGDQRRPYRVAFPDERPFAMAGIYATWTATARQTGLGEFGADGPADARETRRTFAIVTAAAPPWLQSYHHRTDVVLAPDDEDTWLTADPETARRLWESPLPDEMELEPASLEVNDVSNDGPFVLEPSGADTCCTRTDRTNRGL